MSLRTRLGNQQEGERFPETVAQWRLQLRTEVKNSSALPTSVFHGRDAQLEAMLAASTEAMLARLQVPTPAVRAASPGGQQRLEAVPADELRALPARLADDGTPPQLDDHAAIEALAVLTDAALGADPIAADTARALLRERLGASPGADVEETAARLRQCLLTGLADDPAVAEAIAAVARRVANAIATESTPATEQP
ncbi:MAG: hypothetical protein FJ301_03135 [Planctomycetes bacterium]|nr:hypothetical protein [Planctomycetota bacterium]